MTNKLEVKPIQLADIVLNSDEFQRDRIDLALFEEVVQKQQRASEREMTRRFLGPLPPGHQDSRGENAVSTILRIARIGSGSLPIKFGGALQAMKAEAKVLSGRNKEGFGSPFGNWTIALTIQVPERSSGESTRVALNFDFYGDLMDVVNGGANNRFWLCLREAFQALMMHEIDESLRRYDGRLVFDPH